MNTHRVWITAMLGLAVSACGGGGGGGGGGGTTPPAPDTTPPNTTISSGPANPTNETQASFAFTSSETGSSFECSLDGAAFATCASMDAYTGLTEGNHTFSVRATDSAGNTDGSPATADWVIDLTPPDTSISATPASLTNLTAASFAFSSSETASTFQCSLDGGAMAACTSPLDYAGLAEGDHSFSVQATDAAGNTDATPATFDWEIDVTPPDTTITSGPADPTNLAVASFEFTSSEAGGVFECSLNGAAFAACTSPQDYAGLAEGGHSFSVRATDAAGNTDASSAVRSWVVDFTPPDTSISSGPDNPTNSTAASLVFTSTEPGSTFQCSLDGAAFVACASPLDYAGLTEGIRTFDVRATDAAGNTDATPATYSWEIDLTPPETNITSGPDDPTNSTDASFVFNSSETGSTFQCSLDGATFTICSSPDDYSGLTEGNHSYEVQAIDAAGNTDATPATFDWTIDLTPPVVIVPLDIEVVAIDINGAPATEPAIASFLGSATATDDVDGDITANITNNAPSTFPVGFTTVTFSVTDAAGNSGSADAIVEVIEVDTEIPDTASIVINNDVQYGMSVSEFTARLIAQDNVGITDYLITEHNSTNPLDIIPPYLDPMPSDGGWVSITETAILDITIQFPLTQTYSLGDIVELCAWFMDAQSNISVRVCDSITYGVDWESGIGNWSADNGLWQVGTPSVVGPTSCFAGTQCVGTVLDGNYTSGTDSRLISASTVLPTVTGVDEIHLRFQQWFWYHTGDTGQVQVSVWDPNTSTWGAWISEGTTVGAESSAVAAASGGWSLKDVDLSAYSGETVRIGFLHTADTVNVAAGWYVDDIVIVQTTPAFTGSFETGWDDWGAGNGLWQVGTPSVVGPTSCFAGTQCVGTVLDGNYTSGTDSRLISASTVLPTVTGVDEIHLRFQQWFWYHTGDTGQVQVSVWDPNTSTWGAWISEGTTVGAESSAVAAASGGWSLKDVDLSAYSGETVRIGFLHTADTVNVAAGWYVDDIVIVQTTPAFTGSFETGWDDWGAGNGLWQVGTPSVVGPTSCFAGTQCVGTVLDGNYTSGTDSRLISASTVLPTVTGVDEIHLRFQQWFWYHTGDTGQVQVSVWDPNTSTWGAWISEGTTVGAESSAVAAASGGWSLKDVDLSAYSGETVRIGFLHTADTVNVAAGWYVDDIVIVQTTPAFTGSFETGWDDWGAGNGLWQVGTPSVVGPTSCFAGTQCVGTVLDGNYTSGTDSRLISASTVLPTVSGAEGVHLRFQQWFSYHTGDSGQVQVSVWDPNTSTWGAWISEGTSVVNSSGGWSLKDVTLTAYAGETVRIGFLHTADTVNVATGWYIDDVTISVF